MRMKGEEICRDCLLYVKIHKACMALSGWPVRRPGETCDAWQDAYGEHAAATLRRIRENSSRKAGA